MKKLFTALLLVFGTSLAFAGDVTEKINPSVEWMFGRNFPNATNLNWSADANFQKATYSIGETSYTTFYNWDNEFVATTSLIKAEQLPAATAESIQKSYKEYSVGEIVKYDNGEVTYFVKLNKGEKKIIVLVTPGKSILYFSSWI